MEPGAHICKQLSSFHPKLRLGWDGESGAFGLIQLFHKVDAAKTMREPWNHGPVFSKSGRPKPDWDPLTHQPFYIIRLTAKDVGFDPKIEGWGRLLKLVKRWARPIAARQYNSAKEKGRQVEQYVQDLSFDMAERLYKRGAADGAGAPMVAKKHATTSRNMERYRAGDLSFEDSQLPPAPPGGWDKHLANDRIGESDPDNLGSIGGGL